MKVNFFTAWRNNPILVLLFLLPPLACNLSDFSVSGAAPTPVPEASMPPAPTFPTTALPQDNPADPTTPSTALIDAAELDFAERRIIDVYKRVAPSVVNITTQVLQRSFFFEVIPAEGAGYLIKGEFLMETDPDDAWVKKLTYRYETPEQAEKDIADWADLDIIVLRLKPKVVLKVI